MASFTHRPWAAWIGAWANTRGHGIRAIIHHQLLPYHRAAIAAAVSLLCGYGSSVATARGQSMPQGAIRFS